MGTAALPSAHRTHYTRVRVVRGDKILRSRVQSQDETTFYHFFHSILNYNGRGTQGGGGEVGGGAKKNILNRLHILWILEKIDFFEIVNVDFF